MEIPIPPDLEKRITDYSGNGRDLETALGTYALGYLFGWRVLYMINSQKTIRAHQKILQIDFRESLPERTELTGKSLGVRTADKLGSFWAVIRGSRTQPPLPDRGEITAVARD